MANTVPYEPRSFHAATDHPLELARANAFLGRAHEIYRLQPVRHRDMAIFEDGADLHRELLTALITFTQARARGFASKLADTALIAIAAVRADWAGRPEISLYIVVSGLFILEVRGVEVGSHDCGSGMGES